MNLKEKPVNDAGIHEDDAKVEFVVSITLFTDVAARSNMSRTFYVTALHLDLDQSIIE